MPGKKTSKVHGIESFPVRLVWDSTDNLETIYVNHAAIVRSGPEYYVVFGELVTPLIRTRQELPKELHITPKVRLAISPNQMKAIAEVLYQNVNADVLEKEEKDVSS